MAQTTAEDEVKSGLSGRTIILIFVGFVALILGEVLAQDGGSAQCILPFVGFVIALAGLAISFLGLHDDIFRRTVQTAANILMRSATYLILLGVALFLIGACNPFRVRYYSFTGKARLDVYILTQGAEAFKTLSGAYPVSLNELIRAPEGKPPLADWNGDVVADPWDVPYEYDPEGPRNGGRHPDIWTITPDGELIGNWMPPPANREWILPSIGFMIAFAGLMIAFMRRWKEFFEAATQELARILRTSAAGMIVLGFLLYIGASFGPRYLETTKSDDARASINTLSYAAEAYKLKNGAYPTNLDQLVQPPDGGSAFVEPDAILDPWQRRYGYNGAGPHNHGKRPDIWTVGHDGKIIANWIPPSRCD